MHGKKTRKDGGFLHGYGGVPLPLFFGSLTDEGIYDVHPGIGLAPRKKTPCFMWNSHGFFGRGMFRELAPNSLNVSHDKSFWNEIKLIWEESEIKPLKTYRSVNLRHGSSHLMISLIISLSVSSSLERFVSVP